MKLLIPILLMTLSSCATVLNSNSEFLPINTFPKGATAKVYENTCTTPCSFKLERGRKYVVEISKKGHKTEFINIGDKSLDSSLWGNIFFGAAGVIGVGIDLFTQKGFDFSPGFIEIHLEKES